MQIRQTDLSGLDRLAAGSHQSWLAAARAQLADLSDQRLVRVLIAVEEGRIRAVLGFDLTSAHDVRPRSATIRVLEVDPEHGGRGIGSRLVRFAEGIAHLNGCRHVHVAPGLALWGGSGKCWTSLGYGEPGAGLLRDLAGRYRHRCA